MRQFAVPAIILIILAAVISPLFSGAHVGPPRENVVGVTAITPPSTEQVEPDFTRVRGREGFWRVAQDAKGVWWFVSPVGKREFLNTVTTVQPYQLPRDPEGPHYVSIDWTGTQDDISQPVDHPALQAWAVQTLGKIKAAGFKGLGAWSHPVFHTLDVPVTRDLNLWAWVPGPDRRLYSPGWRETIEVAVKTQVVPLKDNTNLVGYYTDNELDWTDSVSPSGYFNGLAPTDPNRMQVMKVLRTLWPDVESFNADWQTSLTSLDEIDAWTEMPHTPVYNKFFSAWLEHLARDYFRITSELVRQYDPNHLVLGVRYKGWAPPEVVRASRGLTDVQSLNYYVADAKLDQEQFRMVYEASDQPLIISEYAFHALDGRSGNRNTFGFSAQVLDQRARADGYKLMTMRLARLPWVIGADWFQWSDEPPSGRVSDGEDVNFGVVDIDDRPYDELVSAIRQTTPLLNDAHSASHADDGYEVWRDSFAFENKPTFSAPRLASAPRLNGELSDWPAASRLGNIRRGNALGTERSTLPVPVVYLGWRDEGLYVGLEVFDRDITGAPAKGWWWTRDNAEFWVSTRPVTHDQDRYDPYSHQFFFVPVSFPEKDGVAGVVGQWHRSGDALKDNLIPHPQVKSATRVLPDRYVAEIFIPRDALNGFDPVNQPVISFNFHAKDFQHAVDYFWSAPKEVVTQLRPKTWGNVTLSSDTVELAGVW